MKHDLDASNLIKKEESKEEPDIIAFEDEKDNSENKVDITKPNKDGYFENKHGEYHIIEIDKKKTKVYRNKHACQWHFCFFCGDKLGPFRDEKHCEEIAVKANFKRRKHPDYSGSRWICKKCRVKELVGIRSAEGKE